MSQIDEVWGAGPSERYEELAGKFRPIFHEIESLATERELSRTLPFDEIQWLREVKFGALRVPREAGGYGATLPELFNLLIEPSAADSNVTQSLRARFGFAEDVVNSHDQTRRQIWYGHLAKGEIAGSAWTEIGNARQAEFSTHVTREHGKFYLSGTKFYTTGSLFADWVDVGAQIADGESGGVSVRRDTPGVNVVDDWDGFGQILTASGTTTFTKVPVEPANIVPDADRFKYDDNTRRSP